MTLAMTREEREKFLAAVHIGIVSIADPPRGPLTVPIWYDYQPGRDLWLITDRGSRKGKLLIEHRRFSLCVQDESPPYKYVTVQGPVVAIEAAEVERDVRPMAHRYLGAEMGDMYVAATAAEGGNAVLVRMKPETWLTVDYSKQYTLA